MEHLPCVFVLFVLFVLFVRLYVVREYPFRLRSGAGGILCIGPEGVIIILVI